MKNKLRLFGQRLWQRIKRWFFHFFDDQVGMRLLSILLAVVLWAAVISQDDAQRFTTVSDLTVEILGLDTLADNELAVKQNLQELTSRPVTVRLDGAKSAIQALNRENLRVVADLSRITSTGEGQTVSLQVRNASGLTVTSIAPYDAIEVDVEALFSREMPVVIQTEGEPAQGYMVPSDSLSVTPATVTVSGTESDVTSIRSVEVDVDFEGVTQGARAQQEVRLVGEDGAQIFSSVEVSDPTVIVGYSVYRTKLVPVEWRGSVTGEPAPGYELTGATVFPAQVTVAGFENDLEKIDKVFVSAISVEGRTESFTQEASFITQTGVRWMDYTGTQVTLNIQEEQTTRIVSEVPFEIVNVPEGAQVQCDAQTVTVAVVGPASFMETLSRSDFVAQVDMLSASYGVSPMPVTFTVVNPDAPELTFMQVSVEVEMTQEAP